MNSVRFVGRVSAVAMFVALAGQFGVCAGSGAAAGNAAVLHLLRRGASGSA